MQVATASQFFISYTIRTFGALTFATIMTTRQVKYKSPVLLSFMHSSLLHSYTFNWSWLWQVLFADEVGEHHVVMCLVFPSPKLATMDRSCKPQPQITFSLFYSYLGSSINPVYNMLIRSLFLVLSMQKASWKVCHRNLHPLKKGRLKLLSLWRRAPDTSNQISHGICH